ncbi:MAG: ATP-binding cassette domain-containing protein [Planctomycetota bacterium]
MTTLPNDSLGSNVRNGAVLEIEGLVHRITSPEDSTKELFRVTVDQLVQVRSGSFTALLGDSGCGKTTLLSILGLLRRPSDPSAISRFRLSCVGTAGEPATTDVAELWKADRQFEIEDLRRKHIGFALQSGDLLASLNVQENIGLPLRLNGYHNPAYSERVQELLTFFELDNEDEGEEERTIEKKTAKTSVTSVERKVGIPIALRRVNKLSGGQFQRVVLARAIAHRPRIAFVDEPTSALNKTLARRALGHLSETLRQAEHPGAVVMITHDQALADEFADMVVRMEPDGKYSGKVCEVDVRSEPVGLA